MTPRLLTRLGTLAAAVLILLYIVYFFAVYPLVHMFAKQEVIALDLGACPARENSLTVATPAPSEYPFLSLGAPAGTLLPPDLAGTIKIFQGDELLASIPFNREELRPWRGSRQIVVQHPEVNFFNVEEGSPLTPVVRQAAFGNPPTTIVVSFTAPPPPGLHLWLRWVNRP